MRPLSNGATPTYWLACLLPPRTSSTTVSLVVRTVLCNRLEPADFDPARRTTIQCCVAVARRSAQRRESAARRSASVGKRCVDTESVRRRSRSNRAARRVADKLGAAVEKRVGRCESPRIRWIAVREPIHKLQLLNDCTGIIDRGRRRKSLAARVATGTPCNFARSDLDFLSYSQCACQGACAACECCYCYTADYLARLF